MANRKALMQFSGMDAVIAKMEQVIANTSGGKAGQDLKKVYVAAARVHSNQVHANIDALNASATLKESLHLCTVVNEGPENKPNAVSMMTQVGALKDVGVFNPYWFEYGTVPRFTGKGAARGKIEPTPVFRPAIQQSKDKVLEVLVDGIKKLVDL